MMQQQTQIDQEKVRKPLLIIAMFSMAMIFVGFTSGYFVSRTSASWQSFEFPAIFTISTMIILLSSVTMHMAVKAAGENQSEKVSTMLWATVALGLGFALTQYLGWVELVAADRFFSGSDVAASYIYVITAAHLVHLLGGLILLGIMVAKAKKKLYTSENQSGIKLGATFWHFLGGLWIYLYMFLMLVR